MELIGPAPLTRAATGAPATSKYVREVQNANPEPKTGRSIDRASTYLEVRAAAPVRSYCLTVQTDLIRPAALNGAPPKHDDMQAVAFVPEMSHFRGHIFVDQLPTSFSLQMYMHSIR
jgi:hypothetical protein